MDLLQNYSNQSDEERDQDQHQDQDGEDSSPARNSLPSKSAAPRVDDTALAMSAAVADRQLRRPIDPAQHSISSFNPTYDQLWAPLQGPAHPYAKDGVAQGMRNHKLGFVEDASIQPFLFDEEQYNTFHKLGYASDPSGLSFVGDIQTLQQNQALSVYNVPQQEQKRPRLLQMKSNEDQEDAADLAGPEVENPALDEWLTKNKKSPWSGKKEVVQGELTEEQKKYAEEYAQKRADKDHEGGKGERMEHGIADKSTFHGKGEIDYQGRSWIDPPKDAKPANDHCYNPKRRILT